VAWWHNGYDVGLVIERLQVRLSSIPLLGNKSGQVVHTRVPLSPSSIIWYRPNAGKVTAVCGKVWPIAHLTELCPQLTAG